MLVGIDSDRCCICLKPEGHVQVFVLITHQARQGIRSSLVAVKGELT